jgi:hypothetical protein
MAQNGFKVEPINIGADAGHHDRRTRQTHR